MLNNEYFDVKRDNEMISAGGFFCKACLEDKPAIEQSPDPRYCQGCYEFLLKEAEMLLASKRPAWIPKPQQPEKADKSQYQVSQHGAGIMSTLAGEKSGVDTITPLVSTKMFGKRGPKHRELPEDLIIQFACEGMGSKAIAARLRSEMGIKVSYKTIQRVLSGERKQLALPIGET